MKKGKNQKPKHYRPRGSGTLAVSPTGLFLARWTYQGKMMSRSTGCYAQEKDGRKKALAKLDEFVKPFLESSKIAVLENLAAKVRTINKEGETFEAIESKNRRIKLCDLYDRYDSDVTKERVTESTMASYSACINHLTAWLKERYSRVVYVDEITMEMCNEYMSDLNKRVADATYNHYVSMFDHVWKILRLQNCDWKSFRRRNPRTKNERRALTPAEVKKLLAEANKLPFERMMLFYMGVYTGMRVSDCCVLKWKDVHMDKRYISFVPMKTKRHGKPVFIPIHPVLYSFLEEMWKRSSDHTGYVSKWNAHTYSRNHITNVLRDVFVKSGIKKEPKDYYGFHLLRHTFVSICANSGVPITVVQAIVGHSCPEITQHYFHLDYNVCMNAVQKIQLPSVL